jgi:hypothetical protein
MVKYRTQSNIFRIIGTGLGVAGFIIMGVGTTIYNNIIGTAFIGIGSLLIAAGG